MEKDTKKQEEKQGEKGGTWKEGIATAASSKATIHSTSAISSKNAQRKAR